MCLGYLGERRERDKIQTKRKEMQGRGERKWLVVFLYKRSSEEKKQDPGNYVVSYSAKVSN